MLIASGNFELEIQARFVLLATGLVDECPTIEGGWSADLHDGPVCQVCDGFEATDKEVAVVGALTRRQFFCGRSLRRSHFS